MITTVPASRALVEDQVVAWFRQLPAGDVVFSGKPGASTVFVAVESPWEVDAWARAMGVTAQQHTHTYTTGAQRPAALPGWTLDVWCWLPAYVAPRIELAELGGAIPAIPADLRDLLDEPAVVYAGDDPHAPRAGA